MLSSLHVHFTHTCIHTLANIVYWATFIILVFLCFLALGSLHFKMSTPGLLPELLFHLTFFCTQSCPHHSRLCWEILPHSLFVLITLGTSANICLIILCNHFCAYLYLVQYYGSTKGKKYLYFCYYFSSTSPEPAAVLNQETKINQMNKQRMALSPIGLQ